MLRSDVDLKKRFFGVKRCAIVTNVMGWKQRIKQPVDHPKSMKLNKCSNGNSEIRVARGSCGAKAPCHRAPVFFSRLVPSSPSKTQKGRTGMLPGFGRKPLACGSVEAFGRRAPICGSCFESCVSQTLGACVLHGPQSASPLNGATLGGVVVTITGEYFGASAAAPGVAAKVGDTACARLEWISRTSITCTVPPGVGTATLSVAVGSTGDGTLRGQCTQCGVFWSVPAATFSYDRPRVTKAAHAVAGYRPPLGGFLVTLTGTGFGTFDSGQVMGVVSSFYGANAVWESDTTFWTSDSQVVVRAPAGVGLGRSISVLVAGQPSRCAPGGDEGGDTARCRAGPGVDYDPPYVKTLRPALAPRDGGRRVTVRGSGFGPSPYPLATTQDRRAAGEADTVGGRNTSSTPGAPAANSTSDVHSPASTSIDTGSQTGSSSSSHDTSNWTRPFSPSPSSSGSNTSNSSIPAPPSPADSDGAEVGVAAGGEGSVKGRTGMTVTIGETACIETVWVSQTAAVCVTPAGQGVFLPVQIMVGDQWSPKVDLDDRWFVYHLPPPCVHLVWRNWFFFF